MLFCCLERNVETSCHKHFVFVSRNQQAPPLTISSKCHNLPRFGGTVLITPGRLQRRQHATKLDIGSESRFLHTIPSFNAPVRGVPVGILPRRLVWKARMAWLPDGEKKLKMFIRFDRIHERDGRTDRRTSHDCIMAALAIA